MQTTTVMYESEIIGCAPGWAFAYNGMYLFANLEEPCLHLVLDGAPIVLKAMVPARKANRLMRTIFSGLLEQLGGGV